MAGSEFNGRLLALSGGVGGAKLARGLAEVLAPGQLDVVVNTADDFDYWGLRICPDLDSVMYALADRNDQQRGWGLKNESWRALEAVGQLGGDNWFQLGDQDLATHLLRTQQLREGASLTAITASFCQSLGVAARLLPMTEQSVATRVHTDQGVLGFQQYFVGQRCEPVVKSLQFSGINEAEILAEISQALAAAELQAVLFCPSNPFLSLDPILQLPGMVNALKQSGVPIIAVSPIVAGLAVKGPAAKLMKELNMPATATAVAEYYQQQYDNLLDGFVIDSSDAQLASEIATLGLEVLVCPTLMQELSTKAELARACLAFAGNLKK